MALSDHRDALAAVWASRMPITGALGIDVVGCGDDALVLRMPLLPNRNHKGTVFAGSLAALATLAGWSMLWLVTREAGEHGHIVIQDSTIRYLRPVRSDVTAHAAVPAPDDRDALLATFRRRGRARVTLEVVLRDHDGETVTTFRGRYVLHREGVFSDDGGDGDGSGLP